MMAVATQVEHYIPDYAAVEVVAAALRRGLTLTMGAIRVYCYHGAPASDDESSIFAARALVVRQVRYRLAGEGLGVTQAENGMGQMCLVASPHGSPTVEVANIAIARLDYDA